MLIRNIYENDNQENYNQTIIAIKITNLIDKSQVQMSLNPTTGDCRL